MELDQRKLKIIQTIIDDYILTAVPVGSRTISKRSDLNLSSATIRNEMSDLEEMGYLGQPHTSAGRIPSDKAYRLYVNTLMKQSALTQGEINYIRQHFSTRINEAQQVIAETARVLSKMTNYTSMVMAPQVSKTAIKHVQLVPVTTGRALAIIVTTAGIVHDTMIAVPASYDVLELEKFSTMLTNRLKNIQLRDAVTMLEQEMGGEMQEHRVFLEGVADVISKNMKNPEKYIVLDGTTNLFMYPEYSDLNKAQNMLAVLETKEMLYKILNQATKMEFTVTIGAENDIEVMKESSIVTATYKIGNTPIGSFGVIGPTRMHYSKVVAVLNCICVSLSEIFTNMNAGDG